MSSQQVLTGATTPVLVADDDLYPDINNEAVKLGRDQTVNGNNATQGTQAAKPVWKTADGALFFDGVDDFLSVPDSNVLSFGNEVSDTPFTAMAWINMVDATLFPMFTKLDEYLFDTDGSDRLNIRLLDNGVAVMASVYTTTAITAYEGIWTHVAGSYSGSGGSGGLLLYLNGIAQATTVNNNGSYVAMHNTANTPRVGSRLTFSTRFAKGNIDDAFIFNTAMSQADIQAIMATSTHAP